MSPAEQKITKTVEACTKLKAKNKPLISQVAKVIGILVSNFPGVQYSPLHYRQLEKDKSSPLKTNTGNYNSQMRLSNGSLQESDWWIQNMPTAKRELVVPTNNIVMQTDASKAGWGAVSQGEVIGGRWTSTEALRHIKSACLYFRDIAARLRIIKILIFCLKDTFGELSSKTLLKVSKNF